MEELIRILTGWAQKAGLVHEREYPESKFSQEQAKKREQLRLAEKVKKEVATKKAKARWVEMQARLKGGKTQEDFERELAERKAVAIQRRLQRSPWRKSASIR